MPDYVLRLIKLTRQLGGERVVCLLYRSTDLDIPINSRWSPDMDPENIQAAIVSLMGEHPDALNSVRVETATEPSPRQFLLGYALLGTILNLLPEWRNP